MPTTLKAWRLGASSVFRCSSPVVGARNLHKCAHHEILDISCFTVYKYPVAARAEPSNPQSTLEPCDQDPSSCTVKHTLTKAQFPSKYALNCRCAPSATRNVTQYYNISPAYLPMVLADGNKSMHYETLVPVPHSRRVADVLSGGKQNLSHSSNRGVCGHLGV